MTEFGKPHRYFGTCTSTNDAARHWAQNLESPAPSGALVTAGFQTQGRGQRGHQWQSEAGQSALMSFVYRLPSASDNAGHLGFVTALAVAEAMASFGVTPQIKWPNDLLLNGGKVGGILVEVAERIAILGIGINVCQEEFEGSAAFAYPPTSLQLASEWGPSVESVVEATGRSLTLCEECLRRDGFSMILERCRAWLAVGAFVRQGEAAGELIGLSESGAARVRLADGTFAEWTTVN